MDGRFAIVIIVGFALSLASDICPAQSDPVPWLTVSFGVFCQRMKTLWSLFKGARSSPLVAVHFVALAVMKDMAPPRELRSPAACARFCLTPAAV
jgi:hypothetical protein